MRTMSGGPCLHFDCTNRNSFGYCRTTACINENYRHEEWIRTSNRTEPVIAKPQTNADRFDYDRTRLDPKFHAVMRTAERVKRYCDKAFCPRCPYHRSTKDPVLVVCFTERLADELIMRGLINEREAETLQEHAGR